jgi:hypothetical protein
MSGAILVDGATTLSPDGIRKLEQSLQSTEHELPPDDTPVHMSILREAQGIIYGDREKTYGAPDKNLKVIAGLWSAYLGIPISIDDVCILMILLKAARLKNTPDHRDSMVDLCGYAALMERVQNFKKETAMR